MENTAGEPEVGEPLFRWRMSDVFSLMIGLSIYFALLHLSGDRELVVAGLVIPSIIIAMMTGIWLIVCSKDEKYLPSHRRTAAWIGWIAWIGLALVLSPLCLCIALYCLAWLLIFLLVPAAGAGP